GGRGDHRDSRRLRGRVRVDRVPAALPGAAHDAALRRLPRRGRRRRDRADRRRRNQLIAATGRGPTMAPFPLPTAPPSGVRWIPMRALLLGGTVVLRRRLLLVLVVVLTRPRVPADDR